VKLSMLLWSYHYQVIGPTARPVTAKVVDLASRWDGANESLIGESVRLGYPSLANVNVGIAFEVDSVCVVPTRIRFVEIVLEAF
jgi:hypothetical protein